MQIRNRLQIFFATTMSAILPLIILRPLLWSQKVPPDSQFYTGYVYFGDLVFDSLGHQMPHAPYENYFFTRVGYIVPARLSLLLFGDNNGYIALRIISLILISAAVAVTFADLKLSRIFLIQLFFTTNSLILASLSGDYPSSFGIAISIPALLLIHKMARESKDETSLLLNLITGIIVSVAFWTYPGHLFVLLAVYFASMIVQYFKRVKVSYLVGNALAFILGFISSSVALIFAGKEFFPSAKIVSATFDSIATLPKVMSRVAIDQQWPQEFPITPSMSMWWMFIVIAVVTIAYEITKRSPREAKDFYLPLSGLLILGIFALGAYQNLNYVIRGWVWSGSLFAIALIIMAEYLSQDSKPSNVKTNYFASFGLLALSLAYASFLLVDLSGLAAAFVTVGALLFFIKTLQMNTGDYIVFRNRSRIAVAFSTLLFVSLPNFVLNSQATEVFPYYYLPQAQDFGAIYDDANDFSEIDDTAKSRAEEIFSRLPKSQYYAVNLSLSDPVNDYLAQMLLWPANVFEPENTSMMNDLISKGFKNYLIIGPTQMDLQDMESYQSFETNCFEYTNPSSGDGEFCIAILD